MFTLTFLSCLPYSYAQTIYRGAQVGPDATRNDIDQLRSYGANIVRYQIVHYWGAASLYDCNSYRQVIVNATGRLTSQLLGTGVKYIIVLMMPFGDRHNNIDPVMTDTTMQNCMIEGVKDIAVRVKDIPDVIAIDVFNEPLNEPKYVNTFIRKLHAAVRSVDRNKIVIVKPRHDSSEFYDTMPYYKDQKVWYGVHQYLPGIFSHHGVFTPSNRKAFYPTRDLTKAERIKKMEGHVAKVIAFQNKYPTAKIVVTEFGASIFTAPDSRVRWFSDNIHVYEKYGFNWLFHAYREAPVWDVEAYPNLLQLFQARWRKNR